MKIKIIAALVLVTAATSVAARSPQPIELAKLVSIFMITPDATAEWSMGADASTPQIEWTSSGVETCGENGSCREGEAFVSVNGKQLQNLKQRLEPLPWAITMASDGPSKFGPERVEIAPKCDTVQCEFDFKSAALKGGLALKQLCRAGPGSFRETAYQVTKSGKIVYAVVGDNAGSGGVSNTLTLFFSKPDDVQSFCAEAKSAE